jgi:protoheme IX farnesyltransferase
VQIQTKQLRRADPLVGDSISLTLLDFLALTKPRVMTLVIFTGLAALVVEGTALIRPLGSAIILFALYLTGGSANAFNQYFERKIDGRMTRTRLKRPLPNGRLSPAQALGFSLLIGAAGVTIFGVVFNWLAAVLALGTILFYSIIYTLILKPNTEYNIVIGGAAGAMAPVIAWAAAAGTLSWMPLIMFLVIFLWTPPHFWALAITFREDYQAAGFPMLPVTKGTISTYRQILAYSLILLPTSLLPAILESGLVYAMPALILSSLFIVKSAKALKCRQQNVTWKLFGFSITYLFALFSALIVDSLLRI